jgi:hypothetical protein
MSLDEELFEAVKKGDIDRVRELLAKGANVNTRDRHKDSWTYAQTPLHAAAHEGHTYVARLLLEHGADLNARDKYGFTPLFYAAGGGHIDIVSILLEHGADVNARDKTGNTPLHHVALLGKAVVTKLLLELGADVNARDEYGWTPLHSAALRGNADVARLLLEHGADPSIRDKEGKTPLDVARERGHEEVARVIEEFVKRRKSVGVGAVAPQEPASASLSILGVECPGLCVGEWGRLLVRVRGSGTATLSLEGDVEWLDLGRVKLSGEAVIEVPVRSKASGEVPVRVVVKSPSGEDSKITWLRVADKVARCPACGAHIEPGAKYCWKCGAKLEL